MANYSMKIDLLKFAGATMAEQNGARGVFIPVEQAGLFLGQKGVYADLQATAMQNPQYGDTHCIKLRVGKDKYQAMTEEQRRAIPILGGMRELAYQQGQPAQQPAYAQQGYQQQYPPQYPAQCPPYAQPAPHPGYPIPQGGQSPYPQMPAPQAPAPQQVGGVPF